MHFKTMMLVLAVVALIVTPALAGTEKPAAKRMDIETFLQMNNYELSYGNSRSFFEGFEGGVLPATWAATVTNAQRTWDVTNSTDTPAVEGLFCAYVGWDEENPQDETISFDYAIAAGDDQLSFYMGGSRSHEWADNVSETVEINGTEVFNFDLATQTDYTMERFDVDLSAWDGQTVTVSFRYYGFAGDLQVLDAVTIDDGTGWIYVPPPPSDCGDAIAIAPGDFNINGDTSAATNNFNPGPDGCTGYYAMGNDVSYIIALDDGDSFNVTMTTANSWDDSIYLVTDCMDVANSCVIGSDEYPDGSNFSFTNTSGAYMEYFLIVDGYSFGGGVFNITGTNGGLVATENVSWGSVKAMYR